MSLNRSCIETGVYVVTGAQPPKEVCDAVANIAAIGAPIRLRTMALNRRTFAGTVAYPVPRDMVHEGVRIVAVMLAGVPSVAYTESRYVWYGAVDKCGPACYGTNATANWQREIASTIYKGTDMNYQTSPYHAPPQAPGAPVVPRANYTPAEQLEQAKAAVLAAEQAVQAQVEAEHAAAVAEARKQELAHAELIATLHGTLTRAVQMLEAGHTPTVFGEPGIVEHRKELAPYVESLGYKFVTVGVGQHVALCKRGAR